MWLTCRGTHIHSSMLGNTEKQRNSTNFRNREKEKKLKGKVLDTHIHAHTATHTVGAGMTHELQAKSNMFSAERRECS